VESARIADREMFGLFRSWRNTTPASSYRAVTDAHIAWLQSRHAKCPASWDDLAKPLHRRNIDACLEAQTRQRAAEIAAMAAHAATAPVDTHR
jgi:uncharacterized protein YecT (DUF1311 family)